MYRIQLRIQTNIDSFLSWLGNEIENIPPRLNPISISEFESKEYYLEILSYLFPKEEGTFFIHGEIYENEIKIADCSLIRIKTFQKFEEQYIVEISSEIGYQGISYIYKEPEEVLILKIFAELSETNIAKLISPFIDWLSNRIVQTYYTQQIESKNPEEATQETERPYW